MCIWSFECIHSSILPRIAKYTQGGVVCMYVCVCVCVCACVSFRTGSRNTGVRPKIMLANDQANTHKASQVESHAFMTLRIFVNKTHEYKNVPG